MGEHAADVVQHESEAGMLQDRAVGLLQDVAQVRLMVVANPADVRVQPRLPGPVAHLAGELSDVLRVARRLAAVESLQPARTAHLPQVRGEFAVVDGRPGNEEHFGLHASHGTADYRDPPAAPEALIPVSGRFASHRASVGRTLAARVTWSPPPAGVVPAAGGSPIRLPSSLMAPAPPAR